MGKEYITDELEVSGTLCIPDSDTPGTNGQVLTKGNGGILQWATPPSGGVSYPPLFFTPVYLKTNFVNETVRFTSSMTKRDVFNTTPVFSSAGISVTNVQDITVTSAGMYKITLMAYMTSNSNRTNLSFRLAFDSVFSGPVAAMGYIKTSDGHNESSVTYSYTAYLATNEEISVGAQQLTNFFNTVSIIGGTSSSISIHKIGQEIL
jgi:hypothetical protein